MLLPGDDRRLEAEIRAAESLSFFFVQLAPYFTRRDFTAVRNAQMAALKLPKTGYAVAIDLGHPFTGHPDPPAPQARGWAEALAVDAFCAVRQGHC